MVKHSATNGASGSNPSEEVMQRRGREEQVDDPVVPRRERSKDMISAFDVLTPISGGGGHEWHRGPSG